MNHGWAAALATIALLVAVAWLAVRGSEGASVAHPAPLIEERSLAAHALLTDVDAPPPEPNAESQRQPVLGLESAYPAKAEPPTEAAGLAATIRGRLLLPQGDPAGGTELRVHGWRANEQRVLKYGIPSEWVDPVGTSADDGSFALVFDPPRAFQFVLDARLEGYALTSWRWGEIPPGATVDVGDVVLVLPGTIEGRLVDAKGEPLSGAGWIAYADGTPDPAPGRVATRCWSAVGGNGRFRIQGMPSGRTEISAHHGMAGWIRGAAVWVRAGETVPATLVYGGPRLADRITVTTFSQPFHVMSDPETSSIVLEGTGTEPRVAERVAGSTQTYVFDGLAPGSYAIEIRDPRYEPWRQEGVRPGRVVEAHLKGSSALRLDVRDVASGAPVERYALRVRFRNIPFSSDEVEVHDGSEVLPDGVFEGMFPGDSTLTVSAEGFGPAEVDVDDLRPGETRAVAVRLGEPTTVWGRLTAGGRPLVGIRVLLHPPAEIGGSPARPGPTGNAGGIVVVPYRQVLDETTTVADGRFEFALSRPGTFVLSADRGGGLRVKSDPFQVKTGERMRVDLVLPAPGKLVGRVLAPEPSALAGMRLWVRAEMPPLNVQATTDVVFRSRRASLEVELGEDGAFEVAPLAPGPVRVYLRMPRAYLKGPLNAGAGDLELARLTIPEGETVRRDFSIADRLAGTVEVLVLNHGKPLPGASVHLDASGTRLATRAGENGRTNPIPVFPGTWKLWAAPEDGSWTYRHPAPVGVAAGEKLTLEIDTQATQATLRFLDAETGEPLASRRVSHGYSGDPPAFTLFMRPDTTDETGRLTLTLAPGEYTFVLDPPSLFEDAAAADRETRTARMLWTPTGPAIDEVRL